MTDPDKSNKSRYSEVEELMLLSQALGGIDFLIWYSNTLEKTLEEIRNNVKPIYDRLNWAQLNKEKKN